MAEAQAIPLAIMQAALKAKSSSMSHVRNAEAGAEHKNVAGTWDPEHTLKQPTFDWVAKTKYIEL